MTKDTSTHLAVITGGTGHVGSAITKILKKSGWRVAVLSSTQSGDDVYKCDITDRRAVASVIENIISISGQIDACIHAAAASMGKDRSEPDLQMTVTLKGAENFASAALPYMKKGAAFIGITTKLIEPGVTPMPMGSYLPAKRALRNFLRTLAQNTEEKKIRVYAVAPGAIAGGLSERVPQAVLEMLAKKTGVGMTTAEVVADIVKKICDDAEAYKPSSSIAIPGEVTAL